PSFAPGLTASVDWFRIKLDDVVGVVPITTVFNQCLVTGDPTFCSRIKRTSQGYLFGDTIEGGGWVATPLENIGKAEFSGVDLQAAYVLPLGEDSGRLSLAFSGSYVIDAIVQPDPNDSEYDCAGLFGPVCAALTPEWRHTARVSWESPWNV